MSTQLQFGPWPAANVAAEIDRRILALLKRGGEAGLVEWQLELLRTLAVHKGREHAISITQLQRLIVRPEGERLSPREIKAAVKELLERFSIPIGSSRGKPFGYFLLVTPQDQADAVRPLLGELRSLARRLRALSGKRELARLWGQLQLELDKEKPEAA